MEHEHGEGGPRRLRERAGLPGPGSMRRPGLASLPDELQRDILRCVSDSSQGFAHALVCRKWRDMAEEAQAACACICKGTGQPEEEDAPGVEASLLLEQLAYFPNLRSLRITAPSLPEYFLTRLPDSLQHLWISEQLWTSENGWNNPQTLERGSNGNHRLQGLQRFRSLETLVLPSFQFPTATWPFSISLRHLQLKGTSSLWHTYYPESFQLEHDRARKLIPDSGSQAVDLPTSFLERLSELRELRNFSAFLADEVTALPESMSQLSNLEELDIYGNCLQSLFSGIGQCRKLRRLFLGTSGKLSLPPSLTLLSRLSHLLVFAEEGVRAPPGMDALSLLTMDVVVFVHLPDNIEYEVDTLFPIPSVQRLRTTCLPTDFSRQTSLQELFFFRVILPVMPPTYPEDFPRSLWRLRRLRILNLEELQELTALPEAIRDLTSLEELGVIRCWRFEGLPDSLAELPRLKKVVLIRTCNVTSLPSSIGTWPVLETLHLELLYRLQVSEPVLLKLLQLRGGLRLTEVDLVEEQIAKMTTRDRISEGEQYCGTEAEADGPGHAEEDAADEPEGAGADLPGAWHAAGAGEADEAPLGTSGVPMASHSDVVEVVDVVERTRRGRILSSILSSKLVAKVALPKGSTIAKIEGVTRGVERGHSTVQCGAASHLELNSDLRFISHSCTPNVALDVDAMEVRALEDIPPGGELSYFYPSTEWDMEQPFQCSCQSNQCVGMVRGAYHLTIAQLSRYELNSHIQALITAETSGRRAKK